MKGIKYNYRNDNPEHEYIPRSRTTVWNSVIEKILSSLKHLRIPLHFKIDVNRIATHFKNTFIVLLNSRTVLLMTRLVEGFRL